MAKFGVISERAFQMKVVQLAFAKGWHVAHFTPAQVRKGTWVTPQTGHLGFPDLVLSRDGRTLVVELKAEAGVASPGQQKWLAHLGPIGRLWRPSDWETIVKELS